MTPHSFYEVIQQIYGKQRLPKPLNLVGAIERVRNGEDIRIVATDFRTTPKRLDELAGTPDPIQAVLDVNFQDIPDSARAKARKSLGQLLIGRAAELAFEEIYRSQPISRQLDLMDHRHSRSGTDYRVHDRSGRPLYRLNVKFHGSRFQKAEEMVGLDPQDCFALATYKIKDALDRQDDEHLPYIFVIVGVFDLSGEVIADQIAADLIESVAVLYEAGRRPSIRAFEDDVIAHIVRTRAPSFESAFLRLKAADWYVLSARKAFLLMQHNLFQRVFALRVRGFAQNFRRAELDMHFSLSQDLTPMTQFFDILHRDGETKMASLLERGSI